MSNEMHERSGRVKGTDPFVAFVYLLLRDHVVAGDMEQVVKDCTVSSGEAWKDNAFEFSNGWLASYAEDVVRRVRGDDPAEVKLKRALALGDNLFREALVLAGQGETEAAVLVGAVMLKLRAMLGLK